LAPVNFDAVYNDHLQRQKQAGDGAEKSEAVH
jgi:preprotein translocase subunit SecB